MIKKHEKINLDEKVRNASDYTELCRIFSNYFSSIVSDLRILKLMNNCTCKSNIYSDPVSVATKIVDRHPSIIDLKKRRFYSVFNFKKTRSTKSNWPFECSSQSAFTCPKLKIEKLKQAVKYVQS